MTWKALLECNGCGTTVDAGRPQAGLAVPETWGTLLWGRAGCPTLHLCPKCLERITVADDPNSDENPPPVMRAPQ